jgi:alpha/beta superfamily hydrolase
VEIDPSSVNREEAVRFRGPAGRLEGRWRPPRRPAAGTIVVCHPHPAHGGTLLNKVVFHVSRTLHAELGLGSLRFNFRGVGASEGSYDEGRGEVEDARAAWTEARRRVPQGPLLAAGFSFGAAMTLRAAAGGDPPAALVLLGIPVRSFPPPAPFPHRLPVAVAHGERDEYTPPDVVAAYLSRWPGTVRFLVVPRADHFFTDRLPGTLAFLTRALREALP